jgi:L-lactate dehydrogenase complex protein LldG
VDELTKVNGKVIRTTENELTDRVIEFIQSRNIQDIHLEPNVLDEEVLQKTGIAVSHAADAGIRVGVTRAICGLADTGSVLEADGEGDKLRASLLPEIHIAILRTLAIYPSLSDAIHLVRETKSAVFITGPSATGDIESVHTIGVHGPGEIIILLVDD